jgi:enoyl-CoA hydratase/carnithine racemase
MRFVEVAPAGPIMTLTLHRPERRNALHGPMWSELGEAARALHAAPPRVVIVRGDGGHFSDNPLFMRLFPAIQEKDEASFRAIIQELKAVVDALATMPCPVIAAIDGVCAGGGLEVALACDLRVAAPDARFSMPEARVGLMPDVGGTMRLMRLVGRARMLELTLSGGTIDAQAALAWGLVNRVAAEGSADATAQALAEQVLTASPTATRELLQMARAPSPSFDDETEAGVRVLASGEVIEGAMAFAERRAPRW